MTFDVEQFAANLRAERARRDLTQGELAEAAGITRTGLCLIEQANRTPKLSTACKLAEALHMDLNDLLGY